MTQTIDIHVRLPEELHRQLKAQAEREQRSLNNLMVLLLRQGIERADAAARP